MKLAKRAEPVGIGITLVARPRAYTAPEGHERSVKVSSGHDIYLDEGQIGGQKGGCWGAGRQRSQHSG